MIKGGWVYERTPGWLVLIRTTIHQGQIPQASSEKNVPCLRIKWHLPEQIEIEDFILCFQAVVKGLVPSGMISLTEEALITMGKR